MASHRYLDIIRRDGLGYAARKFLRGRVLAPARGALLHRRLSRVGSGLRVFGPVELEIDRVSSIAFGDGCSIHGHALLRCLGHPTSMHPGDITVGDDTILKLSCQVSAKWGEIHIGSRVAIGRGAQVLCQDAAIVIGDNTRIAADAHISTSDHVFDDRDVPIIEQGLRAEDVIIEDDVWIGTKVVILPGVTIGRGSVIAAGAVVTRDVSSMTVVGGVPARVIRQRGAG